MTRRSAGILLFRLTSGAHDTNSSQDGGRVTRAPGVEVFLIHPGGPYWAKKDSWSIPKGEYEEGEPPLVAARREFQEETGAAVDGDFLALGTIRQPSGKEVTAWALEGDFDPAALVSNTCEVEWPPRSRRTVEVPEADRAAWFTVDEARKKIFRGQEALLDRLLQELGE